MECQNQNDPYPICSERFADVEISLQSHGHHTVDTPRHGNLSDREDDRSDERIEDRHIPRPEFAEVFNTVQQQHSCLLNIELLSQPSHTQTLGRSYVVASEKVRKVVD